MTNKELVIEAVRNLSETSSLEEIVEEIALLAAIREGEEAADAALTTPHEEVKRMVASQMNSLMGRRTVENQPAADDWKQTVGMFRGDPVFEEMIEEARRLREEDRRQTREPDRA